MTQQKPTVPAQQCNRPIASHCSSLWDTARSEQSRLSFMLVTALSRINLQILQTTGLSCNQARA